MKLGTIGVRVGLLAVVLGAGGGCQPSPEERRAEFVGQCIAVLDQYSYSEAVAKPICACVMDKGEAWRAANPEGDPSKNALMAWISECGRASGVTFDDPNSAWQ